MGTDLAMESQAYIDTHYLTGIELARRAGITEQRLLQLVDAKCIPPHSYEVRKDIAVISAFGEYELTAQPELYYHPDLVTWIADANELAKSHPLAEVAQLVRENMTNEIEVALNGRPVPWSDGMEHAWDYLMDGSFSLCLKNINASDLIEKEVARARVKSVFESNPDTKLNPEDREELKDAVLRYEEVALPFSPHELPESSRRLEIEAAVKKFGLSLTG